MACCRLHGAGLVNGLWSTKGLITVELKTLYGFKTDLLAVVSEAVSGTHIHIDIQSYAVQGGHKPVDQALVQRITHALTTVVSSTEVFPSGAVKEIPNRMHRGDYVIYPPTAATAPQTQQHQIQNITTLAPQMKQNSDILGPVCSVYMHD